MKVLLLVLFTTLIVPNAAHGISDEFKWGISSSLNTTSEISAGKVISYTFIITNTGTYTKQINTPILIYAPREFNLTSFETTGNFSCFNENFPDQIPTPELLVEHEEIYCSPTQDSPSSPITLNPGQSYSFDMYGVAKSKFSINSKAYSLVVYSMTPEQQADFGENENIWDKYSDDHLSTATYPYGEYQAQIQQSQNNLQQNSSSSNTSSSNSATSSNQGGASVLNDVVQKPQSNSKPKSLDESQESSGTRDPNIKSINDDPMSWSELIEKNGTLVVLAFATFSAGLIIIAVSMKKIRHSRKTRSEYQKVVTKLRNEKIKSPTNLNNENKPRIRRSNIKSKSEEKSPWSPV